jgi:hypothetical protein
MINITSKGIVQKFHNGKSDLKGWHANYDGKEAVIKTLDNNKRDTIKLNNNEIKSLFSFPTSSVNLEQRLTNEINMIDKLKHKKTQKRGKRKMKKKETKKRNNGKKK